MPLFLDISVWWRMPVTTQRVQNTEIYTAHQRIQSVINFREGIMTAFSIHLHLWSFLWASTNVELQTLPPVLSDPVWPGAELAPPSPCSFLAQASKVDAWKLPFLISPKWNFLPSPSFWHLLPTAEEMSMSGQHLLDLFLDPDLCSLWGLASTTKSCALNIHPFLVRLTCLHSYLHCCSYKSALVQRQTQINENSSS